MTVRAMPAMLLTIQVVGICQVTRCKLIGKFEQGNLIKGNSTVLVELRFQRTIVIESLLQIRLESAK
jgi:hypothetical protein